MMDALKAYLRVPFALIVWVMETYAKNRDRVKRFMRQENVARTFKIAVAVTAVVWVVVALIAQEEDGQRLTDAVKNLWPQTTEQEPRP